MSMYGANPAELTALGQSLKRQIAAVDAIVGTVSSALGGTTWVGPARQQFEGEWNNGFRTSLQRLSQAFDAAGTDCVNRSAELSRVMGAR